jgi:hypothetical protein
LIHGNEKVVVTGEAHTDNQLPEDAAAELDRLNTRYGMHVASETSFATLVFGQGPKGVETIENLINRERMLEAKRPKQAEMVDDPTA